MVHLWGRQAAGHRRIARQAVLSGLFVITAVVAGCHSAPSGEQNLATPETASLPVFTEVTAAAGLGDFRHVTGAFGKEWFPETVGAGCAFVDYDGDGWPDVLLVGGGTWPGHGDAPVSALQLYRNLGDGTFERVTERVGLGGVAAYGFGLSAADYDNDGDQDFFLSTLGENLLFRNDAGSGSGTGSGSSLSPRRRGSGQDAGADGERRFTEVGQEAGLAGEPGWSTSAIFFDADRDGRLDLYVGNYVKWTPETDIWCTMDGETKSYCTPQAYQGIPGRYYHNNGGGTFSDQTTAAGFGASPGKTLGVAELDYNQDGWTDLVVANDTQRDLLFENDGDGTFTEKGVLSGMAFDENGKARAGMGIDAGDVDNSGAMSIFIGHFSNEMAGVYRHIGNGLFIDRAAISRIGHPSLKTLTFGLFLFDADLDGYLDLFLANGHIAEEIERVQEGIGYRQRAQLFMNRGDGTFEEAGAESGRAFAQPLVARGAAYGDYDRDGDLDVLITENGGKAWLWRNDLDGRASLRVRLEGRESNRDALGARLVAHVGTRRLERRVRTGSSYLSQSEKAVTFGLGAARSVDSLHVYWPGGTVARFGRLEGGQELRLVEGESAFEGTLLPASQSPRVAAAAASQE